MRERARLCVFVGCVCVCVCVCVLSKESVCVIEGEKI